MMDLSNKYKTAVAVKDAEGNLIDYLSTEHLTFLPCANELIKLPNGNRYKVAQVGHDYTSTPYTVTLVVAKIPTEQEAKEMQKRLREERQKKQTGACDS